ncbi:DUF2939 domain-containing protein [Thermomonas sp.]|uniref:DUF2939 domain-containing protein n=1 Tax=Thermomonas sp. TaxID=1971895 RepID=UPI00262BB410|nr:DUF2939 domain-containing protein [Thermomonas sp.]
MGKKAKWGLALVVAALLAVLGYVAAGPWLAINGIRKITASGNVAELWRFVDFDQLRASVGPQIRERIARQLLERVGSSEQPQTLAQVTELIGKRPIDALSSPEGIQHLLRNNILTPTPAPSAAGSGAAANATRPPSDPLKDAVTHFESASLFTATVPNADGKPLVFEFRRDGLSWKLTGLRLPES